MNTHRLIGIALSTAMLLAADAHDWNNLRRLKPGERIQVVQADKISMEGQFARFTDSSITLSSTRGDVIIEKDRVARISTKPPGRRGRNALIGAAVGAGIIGVLGGIAAAKGGESGYGKYVAAAALAYGGIGALIGAVIPPGATVYRVK